MYLVLKLFPGLSLLAVPKVGAWLNVDLGGADVGSLEVPPGRLGLLLGLEPDEGEPTESPVLKENRSNLDMKQGGGIKNLIFRGT